MVRRLVLYSDQIEPTTDPLDDLLFAMLPSSGATIGYLPSSPDPDRTWFRPRMAAYAKRGAQLRFFGLETEFEPNALGELLRCDAIHLTGGNTFRFLYWLQQRGLVPELKRYVARGGVLAGVSAGAILMTPDISTSKLCGDQPFPLLQDGTGLELVDFNLYPHCHGHALPHAYDRVVYGIPDGSGIVVDGAQVQFVGPVWRAEAGSTAMITMG